MSVLGFPLPLFILKQQGATMLASIGLYLAVPFTSFLLLQSIPDLKGVADYGVTAALAVYMVWLWNKHTLRWQDRQIQVDREHREAMAHANQENREALAQIAKHSSDNLIRLLDRYDNRVDKLSEVLQSNMEMKGKLLDAIGHLIEVRACPYADRDPEDLPDLPERISLKRERVG